MATPQHLKEFARKMRPLKEEPDLLETLEVFFQQGCIPSAAAKSLSIHRNNLAYRLDKITALTGLDPTHFEHTGPTEAGDALNNHPLRLLGIWPASAL